MLALVTLAACSAGERADAGAAATDRRAEAGAPPDTMAVRLVGRSFQLELALDPASRYRGLGGRSSIAPDGGMLFVFPRPRRLEFVMRDCRVPIDVAFLTEAGRVVGMHSMTVEPPRRAGESARDYERRLPGYTSGGPARFAIETAGGRLAQVGLRVGDTVRLDPRLGSWAR